MLYHSLTCSDAPVGDMPVPVSAPVPAIALMPAIVPLPALVPALLPVRVLVPDTVAVALDSSSAERPDAVVMQLGSPFTLQQ